MRDLQQIEDIYGLQWRFETPQYTVAMWAEEEDTDPSDSFEYEDDIAFARENDPAHWFCAFVGVFNADGQCIGHDCLGGCSYSSFSEFVGGRTGWRKGTKLQMGGYFPDMIRQALASARLNSAI